MSDNPTFSVTEVVGTSDTGVDEAIRNGIATAAKTLRHLSWFEVTNIRGYIGESDNKPESFQVTMKLGFKYDS